MVHLNTLERRATIMDTLLSAVQPVTGQELSEMLGVSRQVIVQDIAVLRANGKHIMATPRGYTLALPSHKSKYQTIIACKHGPENVAEELMAVVQHGGEVVDVTVEHPVYGQITGVLMIKTPQDVGHFVERVSSTGAGLLSSLTKGVHLHTIRAHDSKSLIRIMGDLTKSGFLVSDEV